ncbi:MAG: PAS domain S-box protein [Candidatus Thiodiazotropha sp. (ex. Lucinisca nassula)]|nr:PAS domain S-box protein [Candidatus Thiodiazotropha sp. (ex. Lucinisca nassula)]
MNKPQSSELLPGNKQVDSQNDFKLKSHHRRLLFITMLPLLLVITIMAANQYHDIREQTLHTLVQSSISHSIAIDGIAKLANDHVLQMQAWSGNYLRSPPSYPSDLRNFFKPRVSNGITEGYTMDEVPENLRHNIGQLVWYGKTDPRQAHIGEVVLDQALEFFSLARLTHDVTPYFEWSYYFSADSHIVAVYPWFSADDILSAGPHDYPSLSAAFSDWFSYEIYTAGTPEKNPQSKPYWTAPYIDAGGAGAMVSHGAPVYVDDLFRGIVGTDLKLISLEKFLSSLPTDVGRLLILDDKQMLLADTAGSPKDSIRNATEVLPDFINEASLSLALKNAGEPIQFERHSMVALQTSHAPWTLVYLVGDEEILKLLLPRLLPYAVVLIVLIATLLVTFYLLRRELIHPALNLVQFIRDTSLEPETPQPQLPRLWQTWANLVSKTFREHREANKQVQESEQRLQQILNNSLKVVYVRDLEDRFVLVNQPFERLMDITQEEICGKHLSEIFPAETAAQFKANDQLVIQQKKTMEFEETVMQDDGVHTYLSNKFPLFDTGGVVYAVCGISTDITKRKHSEEILRQAALGVSEAKGEEVFDSLVLHLSQAVNVDYAFIGTLKDHDQIQTRALCVDGNISDNISYTLQGSPCANVVGQQFRFYQDNIQQRFPEDDLLRQIGVQSYAAIPLFDSNGKVLGLLAILDRQPLKDEASAKSILQIFAGRAASELEREQVDAALRASEASYRAIFDASEDNIFLHDKDTGAIIDVNDKACESYGYSKEEMLKLDVGELSSGVAPYTAQDAAKYIQRAVQGEHLRFEWHRKNKDGSLHWDDVSLLSASIGGQQRILAFTREITASKEAAEKLRASEAQYREANSKLRESEAFKSAIVENALLGVITIDEKGHVVEFNPAAVDIFGYAKEQAIGSDLADLIIPKHLRKAHRNGIKRYLETGKANVLGNRMELSALRSDGNEIPVEISISSNRVGGTSYFTAFVTDLTEKRSAEAALRSSEDQYRSIFNTASDALILWDDEGKMVDANPAAWEMSGYSKEEFFSKPFDDFIHPTSYDSFKKFKKDVATVQAASTETRAIRKDGSFIELESRSIPMPYRGRPHILTITRDITEQKQIAEELAHQREALRQSEKLSAMGELLAGVAHELNNPLSILMGRTALMENKVADPAIKTDISKIHAAADRCGRIVHTFLSMARQKPAEHKAGNLNDVVNSAIELLGYGLRTSGIELQTQLDPDISDQNMDTDQIGQIVINLLVNAQHALLEQPEPRQLSVETGYTSDGVYCRVSDNGPGVADDLKQRIFDPFFTTKNDSVGTGIGLSVSRSIAREHGGELTLEESKEGAAFRLWFPLEPLQYRNGISEEPQKIEDSQGGHVLVVEDEAEIADLLLEILCSAGLKASWARSGLEAVKWLQKNHCDLILTDIRMPNMDGPGLWRALEQDYPELLPHTAFITGDTLSAAIAPFLKETGAPLLEKPFTPEQVLSLVARLERH